LCNCLVLGAVAEDGSWPNSVFAALPDSWHYPATGKSPALRPQRWRPL